jgi:hypothetical protein
LVDWFRDLGFLQKPGIETKAEPDLNLRLRWDIPGETAGE